MTNVFDISPLFKPAAPIKRAKRQPQMHLCFVLSMPNVGSWNGKWSGAERLYAVVNPISRSLKAQAKAESLAGRSFHYSWSDGWGARVAVSVIDSATARQIKKQSKGFCGYEWMIDSILTYGKIYASHEDKPTLVQGGGK